MAFLRAPYNMLVLDLSESMAKRPCRQSRRRPVASCSDAGGACLLRIMLYGMVGFLTCLGGCGGNGNIALPVKFILPDGYRGGFEIVQTTEGEPLPIEGGALICRIPASGVLQTDTLADFGRYHTETAQYASGRPLAIRPRNDHMAVTDEVALFNIGNSRTRMRFFLGTRSELVEFMKMPAPPAGIPGARPGKQLREIGKKAPP